MFTPIKWFSNLSPLHFFEGKVEIIGGFILIGIGIKILVEHFIINILGFLWCFFYFFLLVCYYYIIYEVFIFCNYIEIFTKKHIYDISYI